jgi:predicted DCC family thiol-disulfide oxidoreductase YuxK
MNQHSMVVLFDDHCILCNRTVHLLLRLDKTKKFKYSSLNGKFGQGLQQSKSFKSDESVIFWNNGFSYEKSESVIQILINLGGIHRVFGMILSQFPLSWLNFGYDFIARNRYRVFGKSDVCLWPSDQFKDLFIP